MLQPSSHGTSAHAAHTGGMLHVIFARGMYIAIDITCDSPVKGLPDHENAFS